METAVAVEMMKIVTTLFLAIMITTMEIGTTLFLVTIIPTQAVMIKRVPHTSLRPTPDPTKVNNCNLSQASTMETAVAVEMMKIVTTLFLAIMITTMEIGTTLFLVTIIPTQAVMIKRVPHTSLRSISLK
ncbi:hypothetical protein RYX36_008945 [Vicia faba]